MPVAEHNDVPAFEAPYEDDYAMPESCKIALIVAPS
ncbi:hypothetical protein FHS22_004839 [Planomonospora venezuelensis]|uniref:Uncharacterized protein n=1 Tax=Planomonospora venezuelensis TaxID=1999 RepID=A0A841D7V4_PLAVE|nr:hypothetical protein [Planomonospora venezuelensis]